MKRRLLGAFCALFFVMSTESSSQVRPAPDIRVLVDSISRLNEPSFTVSYDLFTRAGNQSIAEHGVWYCAGALQRREYTGWNSGDKATASVPATIETYDGNVERSFFRPNRPQGQNPFQATTNRTSRPRLKRSIGPYSSSWFKGQPLHKYLRESEISSLTTFDDPATGRCVALVGTHGTERFSMTLAQAKSYAIVQASVQTGDSEESNFSQSIPRLARVGSTWLPLVVKWRWGTKLQQTFVGQYQVPSRAPIQVAPAMPEGSIVVNTVTQEAFRVTRTGSLQSVSDGPVRRRQMVLAWMTVGLTGVSVALASMVLVKLRSRW